MAATMRAPSFAQMSRYSSVAARKPSGDAVEPVKFSWSGLLGACADA
jgi:hypothetical protein